MKKLILASVLAALSANAMANLSGADLSAANAYFNAHPDIQRYAPWVRDNVLASSDLKGANYTLVSNSYYDSVKRQVIYISQIGGITPAIPMTALTPSKPADIVIEPTLTPVVAAVQQAVSTEHTALNEPGVLVSTPDPVQAPVVAVADKPITVISPYVKNDPTGKPVNYIAYVAHNDPTGIPVIQKTTTQAVAVVKQAAVVESTPKHEPGVLVATKPPVQTQNIVSASKPQALVTSVPMVALTASKPPVVVAKPLPVVATTQQAVEHTDSLTNEPGILSVTKDPVQAQSVATTSKPTQVIVEPPKAVKAAKKDTPVKTKTYVSTVNNYSVTRNSVNVAISVVDNEVAEQAQTMALQAQQEASQASVNSSLARSHADQAQAMANSNKASIDGLNNKFKSLSDQVNENKKQASAGVSGAMAQAAIPQVTDSQTVSFGAGLGGYQGENAVAVGGSFHASQNVIVKGSVSSDTAHNFGYGVGVSVGY